MTALRNPSLILVLSVLFLSLPTLLRADIEVQVPVIIETETTTIALELGLIPIGYQQWLIRKEHLDKIGAKCHGNVRPYTWPATGYTGRECFMARGWEPPLEPGRHWAYTPPNKDFRGWQAFDVRTCNGCGG